MKEVKSDTGQVTFEGFRLPQITAALQSSVEFSVRMPESDERGVIVGAVRSVAASRTITKGALEEAITKGEEAYAALPDVPYVLVTSISARHFDGLGPKEVGGKMLHFDRFLPEPFVTAHEQARQSAEDQVVGRLPDPANVVRAYVAVRVSTSGRSHEEAQERALDALDLLRGVWNLGINRNVGGRVSIGIRRPTNRLSLGPIHSLHHPDGSLADWNPWLESDYTGPTHLYRLKRDWEYIQEYEEWVWRELERIPYRANIEAAIRMYARALDRRDWNTSFVRLWGLLETLTDTFHHEEAQKRVLFLISERNRPFHRQILKHLARYRNRTVHSGHETGAIQELLFQLKLYVEALVEFHLSADPIFDNFADAARFLSLPKEPDALRENARRIEQALRIQEPESTS